jgi:hypothetical protein
MCEGSKESGGITLTPTLKHLRKEAALVYVVNWLHMVLTSLDCYVWLFGEGLVRPSVLFGTEDLDNTNEARYLHMNVILFRMGNVLQKILHLMFLKG